jgi:uncharacterized protein YxeA
MKKLIKIVLVLILVIASVMTITELRQKNNNVQYLSQGEALERIEKIMSLETQLSEMKDIKLRQERKIILKELIQLRSEEYWEEVFFTEKIPKELYFSAEDPLTLAQSIMLINTLLIEEESIISLSSWTPSCSAVISNREIDIDILLRMISLLSNESNGTVPSEEVRDLFRGKGLTGKEVVYFICHSRKG